MLGRVASIEDLAELIESEPQPPCVPFPSERTDLPLPMPDYDEYVSRTRSIASHG